MESNVLFCANRIGNSGTALYVRQNDLGKKNKIPVTKKMQSISKSIKEGALAFFSRGISLASNFCCHCLCLLIWNIYSGRNY